jgi:putative heme-binding domain-containing protein
VLAPHVPSVCFWQPFLYARRAAQLNTCFRSILPLSLLAAVAGNLHVPALAQAPPSPDAYSKFALTREGNAQRGKTLFNDEQRLLCSKCHSVDGTGNKAGPDLFAVGDAFGRRELVQAILQPSATIAPGYGTTIVELKSGALHQGVLKQSTDATVQLMGADGKLVSISAADIQTKSGTPVSLMPQGLHANLSLQEFADLVEYLTTLRQPDTALASDRGMPDVIAPLAKPISLRPVFSTAFTLPRVKAETGLTSFRQIPGQPKEFLVLHQRGLIWKARTDADAKTPAVFLDLSKDVFSERGPNGLLDVAFHPGFGANRKYYLFYQVFEAGKVTTHIVEKRFDAAFEGDSGEPPRVIFRIPSVAEDHSGGCLQFGPDGFLYVVMGDTGPHHDPNGHAQNLGLLLGKILRIDVDHAPPGQNYAVPADNPFVAQAGARPEIWAYGLRNPWRFSFDRLTGDLWLADVGQDRVDEVAIIRRGENHGWNVFEGFEPFSNQFRQVGRSFAKPVFAYRRKYGNSVTGGHVFRGDPQSSFYGVYVCGDYNSKRIFGLTHQGGILKTARQIGTVPQRLVSFSEDESGNLYAVGYEGIFYRLDFTDARFE